MTELSDATRFGTRGTLSDPRDSKDGLMDEIHLMKGQGKPLITVLSQYSITTLGKYSDGSLSITNNGRLIGIWEPDESQDCFQLFMKFVTQGRPSLRTRINAASAGVAYSSN